MFLDSWGGLLVALALVVVVVLIALRPDRRGKP
jgi:hypothetical protein